MSTSLSRDEAVRTAALRVDVSHQTPAEAATGSRDTSVVVVCLGVHPKTAARAILDLDLAITPLPTSLRIADRRSLGEVGGHGEVIPGSPPGHATPAESGHDDEKPEADESDPDDGGRRIDAEREGDDERHAADDRQTASDHERSSSRK